MSGLLVPPQVMNIDFSDNENPEIEVVPGWTYTIGEITAPDGEIVDAELAIEILEGSDDGMYDTFYDEDDGLIRIDAEEDRETLTLQITYQTDAGDQTLTATLRVKGGDSGGSEEDGTIIHSVTLLSENYETYYVNLNEMIDPDEEDGPLTITYEGDQGAVTLKENEDYTFDGACVILTNEDLDGKQLTLTVDERESGSELWGCYIVIGDAPEMPAAASISAAYENGTDDGSGNITISYNVWELGEHSWNELHVTAYDADGEEIEDYETTYDFSISSVKVSGDGYEVREVEDGYRVFKGENTTSSLFVDTSDGYLGIKPLKTDEGEDEPETFYENDLILTYTLTVTDTNGEASATLNVTVNIDVEQ